MAEQNSDNINFNKEEFPIPIPPADQAWQSMRQKLDAELPVEGNLSARVHIRYIWIKGLFVLAVIAAAGIFCWQYRNNTQLAYSGKNVHDTSLAYKQSVPRTSYNHALTDTVLSHTMSSTISNASDTASNTSSSQALPASQSSQASATIQGSSLQPSLIADRTHPVSGKTTTQPTSEQLTGKQAPAWSATNKHSFERNTTAKQQATDKQLVKQLATNEYPLVEERSTAKRPVTDKQLARSFASSKKRSGETATTAVAEPLAIEQQQLAISIYTNKDRRQAGKAETHPPLQLSLIQSSIAGYNISLQHKAAPLALRHSPGKQAEKLWALYIQLNVALPLYDSSFYFLGPDGKDQFYRRLIPTVRIERKLWKGALSLDVQPSVSVTPKPNVHANVDAQLYPFDTTSSLVKQLGWGVALQYQLPVHPKWQVGAGIQASFLQHALMHRIVKDTLMKIVQNGVFPATDEEKQDLSRVHISGVAELDYMAGNWQFGLRTLVPVTRVSKTKDISARPVHMEVVVRRRLWKFR
ncbi:hypothetical protein [Chitinophaga ginsengisoli]|uniref:Uncharacterized protein n=1 Tax=Chitinophaga ginsengisoli TaxID=363837 RepID=A0A2P8G9N6_9BACT|nr:hypothetical protein [Chitinophaga ginsengisoli]PSL30684.1 hypothetical protein CLV42_10545 [Chitinophaga ginsengisoli]